MAISFSEARSRLLSGATLSWPKFGDHKAGSISLKTPAQRRVFEYLLTVDSAKLAQGSEELFDGLIASWQAKSDPGTAAEIQNSKDSQDSWRLHRIQTSGFGGLNLHAGPTFDLWLGGENWCLEGQNGSGKTSLASAIIWTLTGRRIREHDGPIEETGLRSPVTNTDGKKIGEWPACVSYPSTPSDLAKQAEAWVRLTFQNANGEEAIAFRRLVSPVVGVAELESKIDPRLLTSPELLEIGLLMPARLSRIGFGDKSQSLYEAVKMLTGLDQLSDIAEGCTHLTHGARRFLKYGKDNRIDDYKKRFDEHIGRGKLKASELGINLSATDEIEEENVSQALRDLASTASAEAGTYISTLKTEIDAKINSTTLDGRTKIRNAVGNARAIAEQDAKSIPIFEAWASLKEAGENTTFSSFPAELDAAEKDLAKALVWHQRQQTDRKFRLKALAAQSFIPANAPSLAECPLCDSALSTDAQKELASELSALQHDAAEAERRIQDVCRAIEASLVCALPSSLRKHRETLKGDEPRVAYENALLKRFCEEPPFGDILLGLSGRVRKMIAEQCAKLPSFHFAGPASDDEAPIPDAGLKETIKEFRRLVALVDWWRTNRLMFRDAISGLLGQRQTGEIFPPGSINAELDILDQSLTKAEPLDELAGILLAAAKEADKWTEINKSQAIREEIAEGVKSLKELKDLVGAETARSINDLSDRMKAILQRIHLVERLNYSETFLGKKTVSVTGSFDVGMQIDASLVANTSWLRAILWAFLLALRETSLEASTVNAFPLLILDDPQTTFDPRNKRRWAQEIARLGNLPGNDKSGAQIFLTTHEKQFFQCIIELDHLSGEHGLIAGVNKTCGVATVVNGTCLARAFAKATEDNDDALARSYISKVRIYCEDLLRFMLRAEGPHIANLTLGELREALKCLRKANTKPFDGKTFLDLENALGSGGAKPMKLVNDSHHKEDETIGVAQAKEVQAYWESKLMGLIHSAFAIYDKFESFNGEPRTFPWAKNLVEFPIGFREEVKALKFQQTGIAAAAKSDGRAGDGVVTVEEWTTAKSIILHNHEAYQLAAGTLDPVASIGDIVLVSNYAKVHARNLVVAAFGDSLLARRYNLSESHPNIVILTGQSVDPYAISEPVIIPPETETRKIIGTVFTSRFLPVPQSKATEEVVPLKDTNILKQLSDGAKLFKVQGRSAEPIALNDQFLMTRNAVTTKQEILGLQGCPVVAFDENGARYFKRLHCTGSAAILESLNPDGSTAAEILSFSDSAEFPKITHVLEVIGVLFEIPEQAGD